MSDKMNFPKEPMDFLRGFSFKDIAEVYTNGAELIPLFRVEQMLEHYMSCELGNAYNRGFTDGVKKERKRIMTMLGEDMKDL